MDYYAKYLKYKAKYIALKEQTGEGKHKIRKEPVDCWTPLTDSRKVNIILMYLGCIKPTSEQDRKDLQCLEIYLSLSGYITIYRLLDANPELKKAVIRALKERKCCNKILNPTDCRSGDSDSDSDSESVGGGSWWERLNPAQKTNIASAYYCATFLNKKIPESVMNSMPRNYVLFTRMIDPKDNASKENFLASVWGKWVADKHECKDIYVRHRYTADGKIEMDATSE
jgi:hypothetical protein